MIRNVSNDSCELGVFYIDKTKYNENLDVMNPLLLISEKLYPLLYMN